MFTICFTVIFLILFAIIVGFVIKYLKYGVTDILPLILINIIFSLLMFIFLMEKKFNNSDYDTYNTDFIELTESDFAQADRLLNSRYRHSNRNYNRGGGISSQINPTRMNMPGNVYNSGIKIGFGL